MWHPANRCSLQIGWATTLSGMASSGQVHRERPPDGGQGHESELIIRAARTLRRRHARALAPWELSPHQTRALRVIAGDRRRGDATKPLRLSQLAEALHIAPRSATEVVDALENKGLVQRSPDPGDRRAVCLQLTPAGRRVAAEVETMRREESDAFLSVLSASERDTLGQLLGRLLEEKHT